MATKYAAVCLARFFDDLVRTETRLYNALGEDLRREHGVTTTQFELLRYLRDHPDARVVDVATNFAAGIGAISKGVDRLEGRGLVARHANPADRRSSLVALTTAGSDLLAAAETTFGRRLDELVSSTLTGQQVDSIGTALAALRTALERNRTGLPVG
jgi:MarR family transcriptional regulator, multiple antibiotic resistance protein MarR